MLACIEYFFFFRNSERSSAVSDLLLFSSFQGVSSLYIGIASNGT